MTWREWKEAFRDWLYHEEVLYEINRIGDMIMAKFDELKASVEKYIAAVEAWAGGAQVDVQKAIADAVAADDAGEEVDFQALKDAVDAAFTKVPAPTPPVIPASNEG